MRCKSNTLACRRGLRSRLSSWLQNKKKTARDLRQKIQLNSQKYISCPESSTCRVGQRCWKRCDFQASTELYWRPSRLPGRVFQVIVRSVRSLVEVFCWMKYKLNCPRKRVSTKNCYYCYHLKYKLTCSKKKAKSLLSRLKYKSVQSFKTRKERKKLSMTSQNVPLTICL